jgi:hypothetical protein
MVMKKKAQQIKGLTGKLKLNKMVIAKLQKNTLSQIIGGTYDASCDALCTGDPKSGRPRTCI